MAVDGEGGGTDDLGRQNYFLMCASGQTAGEEYILHRDGRPCPPAIVLNSFCHFQPIVNSSASALDMTQLRYCAALSRRRSVKY